MSLAESIMRPFDAPGQHPARRRITAVLVVLAPFIALTGYWARGQAVQRPDDRIELNRSQAVERARKLAAENGVDTTGWDESLRLSPNSQVAAYLEEQHRSPRNRARKGPPGPDRKKNAPRARFLAPSTVQVLLTRPDGKAWVRVELAPDGSVLGYRLAGAAVHPPERELAEAEARGIAEQALKEWLGDLMVERLGAPETSTLEEAEFAGTRRFIWHAMPRNASEMEVVLTIDVLGDRIVERSTEPSLADSFLRRIVNPRRTWAGLLGTLRTLLIAFLALYACYRYARRAIEKEAPHGRVAALALIYVAFLVASSLANPDSGRGDLSPQQMRWAVVMLQALIGALLGLLLGVAYGAGEGEVREGWPGKLVSLDTLLTGRLGAANTGVAVLGGTAVGLWLFGASELGRWAAGASGAAGQASVLGFAFTRMPLLSLFATLPIGAFSLSVLDLLAPLTFLRRHVRSRALQIVLLAVLALMLGPAEGEVAVWAAGYWIQTVAIALAVLLPFFLFDYLASVVAVTALVFALRMMDLVTLMPAARWRIALALTIAGATWLAAALAAWRGKRYEDHEVRPEHARNLAERLSLRAELNAAREAQLRLLPERPPEIGGLSIAASCTPAQEVGGDYYDFFPLEGGRLGMIVAEGGNDGLASALTIAMAKGFLMHESAHGTTLEETLRQLRNALGGKLARPSGETSLALFVIAPHSGRIRVARVGAFPRLLVLKRNGQVSEPALTGAPIAAADLRLEHGESAVIFTDGLARLMEQHGSGSPEELLRRAATFGQAASADTLHAALLDVVLRTPESSKELLTDDLTAIVLRRYEDAARGLEEVA